MKYVTSLEEQYPDIEVLTIITLHLHKSAYYIDVLLTESRYQVAKKLEFCSGNWKGMNTVDTQGIIKKWSILAGGVTVGSIRPPGTEVPERGKQLQVRERWIRL